MKKLLLSFMLLFVAIQSNAQLSCASPTLITANGTITAPAVTGTFSNVCYNNTLTSGGGAMKAIWYSYTPTSNGEVTMTSNLPANVAPNSVDTKVSIFTGTCAALVCYDANDDTSATNFLSTITFPVASGTTYYIAWDNYWDAAGFNFTFNFTAQTCVKPFYINNVTNLGSTSVTLNWDVAIGNPAQYDIEYGASGFVQGAGTTVTSATNSKTLTGLTAGGLYDFYIRSNCGTSNQSTWNGPNTFILAKTCPYASGFDNAAQLAGWATSSTLAPPSPGLGTTSANSQSPAQYFIFNNSATEAVNNWLYSPGFILAANESVSVSFYVRTPTGSNKKLKVTVGNAQSAAAQTTTLWSNASINVPTYTQYTTTTAFVAPTAGIYYFAFNDFSALNATVTTMRLDTVNFTSVLSTNDFDSSKFSVYPNPVKDIVTVSNLENTTIAEIQLTDLNGRVVKKVNGSNSGDVQINISDLASGIYMMNISSDLGSTTKKIVKE